MITTAGHVARNVANFSIRFQQILPLISGGPEWLQWALGAAAPAFAFDNEAQLLAEIHFRLHGTQVAVFRSCGVRMAPALLLSWPDPDFGNAVSSLQTSQLTAAALAALARHGVRTERDFAALDDIFADLGVSHNSVLQSLSLSDQIALYGLLVSENATWAGDSQAIAAANFAAAVAQQAGDFVSAFRFYRTVAASQPADAASTATNAAQVWTALIPQVLPYLECASVSPDALDDQVLRCVSARLRQQPLLGFGTLATAIYNCCANAGLDTEQAANSPDAANNIRDYVRAAGDFVKRFADAPSLPTSATSSIVRCQDGVTRWFVFSDQDGEARLQVGGDGHLTLHSFVQGQRARLASREASEGSNPRTGRERRLRRSKQG